MEAKKSLAQSITARYHGEQAGKEARDDWDTRFSKKNLFDAELPEIHLADIPDDCTVLSMTALAFAQAFQIQKSNSELRKQYIVTGSVQLNGEKLTDPNAPFSANAGDVVKLSKKHAVRLV